MSFFLCVWLFPCAVNSSQPLYNWDRQLSFCFFTPPQIQQLSVYINCADNGSQKRSLPIGITLLFIQKVQRLKSLLQLSGSLKPGDAWLDLQSSSLTFSVESLQVIVWVQECTNHSTCRGEAIFNLRQKKHTLYFHDSLHRRLNRSLFCSEIGSYFKHKTHFRASFNQLVLWDSLWHSEPAYLRCLIGQPWAPPLSPPPTLSFMKQAVTKSGRKLFISAGAVGWSSYMLAGLRCSLGVKQWVFPPAASSGRARSVQCCPHRQPHQNLCAAVTHRVHVGLLSLITNYPGTSDSLTSEGLK